MNDENAAPSKMSTVKRLNKPLMERRRRQRINNCLDELKSILETLSKNESSYLSKLEKADILELTVQCIRNLKRREQQHPECNEAVFKSTEQSYKLGYDACVAEVVSCLRSQQGQGHSSVQPTVINGLLDHLAAKRRCSLPPIQEPASETYRAPLAPVNRLWLNEQHQQPHSSTQLEPAAHQMAALGIRVTSTPMTSRSTGTYSQQPLFNTRPPSAAPVCGDFLALTGTADGSRQLATASSSLSSAQLTSSTSHAPVVDFGGRSRHGDQSTCDIAVLHDSDRLRRRVRRPSATPEPLLLPTVYRTSNTSPFSDHQLFSTDPATASPTSVRGCSASEAVTSTVWNAGNLRHSPKSSTLGDVVGLSTDGVGHVSALPSLGDTETADCVKLSPMWRPW